VVDHTTLAALCLMFALGAALYSSVGHGGASAYIAAMALFSVAPEMMKPTALALNLLVAGFGTWRYARRGLSNWKLVLAFALTAVPAAYIGGGIHLPAITYKPLVGILLWAAAARLLWQPRRLAERPVAAPPSWVTLPVAASGGAREKSFRTPWRRSTCTSFSANGEPLGGRTSTPTTDRFAAGARHCPRKQTFALEH